MTVRRLLFSLLGSLFFLWSAWWTARPLPGGPSSGIRIILPGVVHRTIIDRTGPLQINVLEIDLRRSGLTVMTAHALDTFYGRETVSSMAARYDHPGRQVVAGLNGDYFNTETGEVQNNLITEGRFVKAFSSPGFHPELTDVPNSQFAITSDRRPLIDQFVFEGVVVWHTGACSPLAGVNVVPRRAGLVIFNGFRGERTPDSDRPDIAEIPFAVARTGGDTMFCVPKALPVFSSGSEIPAGGFVLSAYGDTDSLLRANMFRADTVRIVLSMRPPPGRIRNLVGGWPRLVREGRSVFGEPDFPEDPAAAVFAKRHPRTGIGFSADSTTLYFVTVDGRQERSAGLSLPEFADLLIALGVHDALNLDGGGSTTMVVQGTVVNSPSDPTGERPVGSCLLLVAASHH